MASIGGKLLLVWLMLAALQQLVFSKSNSLNFYTHLNVKFCQDMKAVRAIYNTINGFDYITKDPLASSLKYIKMRQQFIEDQMWSQDTSLDISVYATGVWIPPLKMQLNIGVFKTQIIGHYQNRNEKKFSLVHATYWSDYLQRLAYSQMYYPYTNKCYILGSISNWENLFRAYRLGFCHDTYALDYFPLNSPCYEFSGENTEASTFVNVTLKDGSQIIKFNSALCGTLIKTWQVGSPNFAGKKNLTTPILNKLFPYEFSSQSSGPLFRSLVWFRGTLYWLENEPLRYRYLSGLNADNAYQNFSNQWNDAMVQEVEITERFYLASAFTFPPFPETTANVYFLLLDKNFTEHTEPVYRKAMSMNPLVFYPHNYTLDEIIAYNCTAWMSLNQPTVSSNSQIIAATMVGFMLLFILLITLLTTIECSAKSDHPSQPELHSQSIVLDKLSK